MVFMYTKRMNMMNSQPRNEGEPSKGRRGFIRGALAGAASMYLGNKYLEKKKVVDDFYKRFEGQESNYNTAVEATILLINELDATNTKHVSISGTGHPNERIEILRNYLTRHLNTKNVGDKYSIRETILKQGYYDKDVLAMLNSEANYLSSTPKNNVPVDEKHDFLKRT